MDRDCVGEISVSGMKNRLHGGQKGRTKQKIKIPIVFFIRALLLMAVIFHIREINEELGRVQTALKKIEDPRYEVMEPGTETPQEADYVSGIEIINVERPMERTWAETMGRLDSLGQTNPAIEAIYQDRALYPKSMLAALANNPEMADYVAGYPQRDREAAGGLTESERTQAYPLFLQWDPRWGYEPYGRDGYIGVTGCGPTCLAMALYYLNGDESLTPDKIAAYALKNGYYVEGTGTAWALISEFPRTYGITVTQPEIAESDMKAELAQGNILICAMRKGDFTVAGHFIVLYGYDESGFFVNDPNCVARSRKKWSFGEIAGQIKSVWSLGR